MLAVLFSSWICDQFIFGTICFTAFPPVSVFLLHPSRLWESITFLPVIPCICKLCNAGIISPSMSNHIFQLNYSTAFFSLLVPLGFSDLYSSLLKMQFILFLSIYVTMLFFKRFRFQRLEPVIRCYSEYVQIMTESVLSLYCQLLCPTSDSACSKSDDKHVYRLLDDDEKHFYDISNQG